MAARAAKTLTSLALVASAAACSGSIEDGRLNLRDTSPQFVSLNPCADAILLEVAAPHQVLAISHYSHNPASSSVDPSRAREFPATSGTVEEIVALKPDLVVAGAFIAPATQKALRDLEQPYETFRITDSIETSHRQTMRIAQLAGQRSRGRDLVMRVETALSAHRAPPGHEPISTVLWQPGEIVPGEKALISQLMREAGFSSHSAALGMGQADYLPLEVLLAHPPELLLVAGQSRGQLHPALAGLAETRVEILEPNLLFCGGPTIIRAMERLSDIREDMRKVAQS